MGTKYIVHVGTQTILDANDEVYVVEIDDNDISLGMSDDEICDYAIENGERASRLLNPSKS